MTAVILCVSLLDLQQFPPSEVIEDRMDFLEDHLDWIRARQQWDRAHQWQLREWEEETLRVWRTWYTLEMARNVWWQDGYRLEKLEELNQELGPDYHTGTMPWISPSHFTEFP